jgi:hypothetical protein
VRFVVFFFRSLLKEIQKMPLYKILPIDFTGPERLPRYNHPHNKRAEMAARDRGST